MTQRLPFSVLKVVSATIKSGTAINQAADNVDLQNYVLVGVEFPATFTGTGITFGVNQDNSVTFIPVYNITITKQTGKLVLVGSTYRVLEGMGRYLQISSSGNESQDSIVKLYLVPRS